MISEILRKWIAQSESWQTFIDFKLPEDSIAKYPFLDRYDDFYISLFGSLYELLEDPEKNKESLLSIAKGLEVYSLKNKRDSFFGINQANNILFASGLYYLADYSSSAAILSNLFMFDNYQLDIEKFLLSFLNRKKLGNNPYRDKFDKYLETGNIDFLNDLLNQISQESKHYFKSDPYIFSIYYLAESILIKFQKNNIWSDLLQHNNIEHWKQYVEKSINKSFPVWDFFPSQKIALVKGILGDYRSISLQTPTSSGKTAICELLIYNELKNNPESKILYLAPFRALASELKQSFGKNLAKLQISSKTMYGGDIPTSEEKRAIQDVSLLIATPEKFMAIENIEPNFSKNFTMIICDEGHLLDDRGIRGLSYELLLSRFKKEANKKFVFLSAIIPNIEDINIWLGGTGEQVIKSNFRATEIEYAFLVGTGSFGIKKEFQLIVNPLSELPKKYLLNKFLTEQDFIYKINSKEKEIEKIYKYNTNKAKSVAIALKSLNSGSVALFTPLKGGMSGVSALTEEAISQIKSGINLVSGLNLNKNNKKREALKQYFKIIFGDSYLLTISVDYGILFHHGDLPQYVREIIEDSIRSESVRLIICTNTLAEGVNLPIRTIVVHSAQRFNPSTSKLEPINSRDLKNLFGRAGRAGKETKGLIIIPNSDDFSIVEKVIKEENVKKVEGFLYVIIKSLTKRKFKLTAEILEKLSEADKETIDVIDTAIIDLLGEDVNVEELDNAIRDLIQETFASYQASASEKITLDQLVALRGEKIRHYITNGEFTFIKKSSLNLRIFEELKDRIDLENLIWTETINSLDDKFLDLIINIISGLPVVQYRLNKFNQQYLRYKEKYLDFEILKKIIKLWVNGGWFKEVSDTYLNDVDLSIKVINSLIGYEMQSIISSIIHIIDLKLTEREVKISQEILDFPQYLIYGLRTRLQLDLMEIGFTDRIGIIELSKILEGQIEYKRLSRLKLILDRNSQVLGDRLREVLPEISLVKTDRAFDFLRFENIK